MKNRLRFIWPAEGQRRSASYEMLFDSSDSARSFQENVLEGRDQANWLVRADDGRRRRLGSATECYRLAPR